MPLYTFVLEFNGGTYIRQIAAPSPMRACTKWAESLDVSQIDGLGSKGRSILVERLGDEQITPIAGTINTWCLSALVRGKLALVTLIQTDEAREAGERNI